MKKILMISAAMAAVLSSCTKSELESVSANENKDIILNISVSDPGADTKALIKTGWTTDDEISIWYDTNTDATPDLVITYNGTKWIQKVGATVSGNAPSTGEGKYAKALYNGTVKVASKDTYTYENNTLTFDIKTWKFLTEVQVVVKGLTGGSAANYTLACDKFTPLAAGSGFTVETGGITASAGTKRAAVTGISNTDGVAFVFATAEYSTTTDDYKFVLTDNTSTPAVKKVYTAHTNKISGTSGSMISIKALTIASTSFYDPVIPEFVDFGLTSGLKWRSWNLGATKPEEYGTYFQWGGTTGYAYNGSTFTDSYNFQWSNAPFHSGSSSSSGWTKYIPSDKSSYWSGTESPDNKLVLESDDDAAYQADPNPSKSWRMPAKEDFTELAKNCFAEWTDSYNGTGVKGVIFWSPKTGDAGWFKPATAGKGRKIKDDGSGYKDEEDHTFSNTYDIVMDSYVFFPAAGLGSGTSLLSAHSNGYYWSSSLDKSTPYYAFNLSVSSSKVSPQNNTSRSSGFSVRPVSD